VHLALVRVRRDEVVYQRRVDLLIVAVHLGLCSRAGQDRRARSPSGLFAITQRWTGLGVVGRPGRGLGRPGGLAGNERIDSDGLNKVAAFAVVGEVVVFDQIGIGDGVGVRGADGRARLHRGEHGF
jgi:hypothetical protein